MRKKAWNVLAAINQEGLDNVEWGLCEDVWYDHFIQVEPQKNKKLKGKWVYVWQNKEAAKLFEEVYERADERIFVYDANEMILLYNVD